MIEFYLEPGRVGEWYRLDLKCVQIQRRLDKKALEQGQGQVHCWQDREYPVLHGESNVGQARQYNACANREKQRRPNETKPYSNATHPRKRQNDPANGHTQSVTTRRRCGRNRKHEAPRELSAHRGTNIAADQVESRVSRKQGRGEDPAARGDVCGVLMCVVCRMSGAHVSSVVRWLFGCGFVGLLVVLFVPLF